MNTRWCGVTSAVTRRPSALARRTISTEPADEVAQVQAASRKSRDGQIARDHDLLCLAWLAREPERRRGGPLVHLSALGQ